MSKRMYELRWHYVDERFSHCTVQPITVIREGVLPGCLGVSITAFSEGGRKFLGSPDNYYTTEADAWAAAEEGVSHEIQNKYNEIAKLKLEIEGMRKFLAIRGLES